MFPLESVGFGTVFGRNCGCCLRCDGPRPAANGPFKKPFQGGAGPRRLRDLSGGRYDDEVKPRRDFVLQETKGLADPPLPRMPDHRVPDLPRDARPEARDLEPVPRREDQKAIVPDRMPQVVNPLVIDRRPHPLLRLKPQLVRLRDEGVGRGRGSGGGGPGGRVLRLSVGLGQRQLFQRNDFGRGPGDADGGIVQDRPPALQFPPSWLDIRRDRATVGFPAGGEGYLMCGGTV